MIVCVQQCGVKKGAAMDALCERRAVVGVEERHPAGWAGASLRAECSNKWGAHVMIRMEEPQAMHDEKLCKMLQIRW